MRFTLFLLLIYFCWSATANVRGSNLHNFTPNTSGLDFISVQSAKTLEPFQMNMGLFLNYVTNSLAYSTGATNPNEQSLLEATDRLLYSNIHLGLGLNDWLEIGFGAGFINSQDIDHSDFLFTYSDTGINDIFLTSKARIFENQKTRFAVVTAIDFEQLKNNPFSGDNAGPTITLMGVMDWQVTPQLIWSNNLGYRLKQNGTPIPNTGIEPIPNQLIYSSGLSYQIGSHGSLLTTEIYGHFPTEEMSLPTDRHNSNLELLISYRWSMYDNLNFYSGLGSEIIHGLGSPDFRGFIGANFKTDFLQNLE